MSQFETLKTGKPINTPVTTTDVSAHRVERMIAVSVIALPFLGTLFALYVGFRNGIGYREILLLCGMYTLTMFGIGGGFHRLFSHRAFETNAVMKTIFTVMGSWAFMGPPLWFAAIHRAHHGLSDQPQDPHSPYIKGTEPITGWRRFYHSHIGWMIGSPVTDWARFVPDLLRDRYLFRLHRFYFPLAFTGLLVPTLLGYFWMGGATGALHGFLFGGVVRLFLVQHAMWSVGSLCHLMGTKTYDTNDHSGNSFLLGLVTFGVGWHNNHHAFQSSARIGLKWWQVDFNFYGIWILAKLGVLKNLKIPSAAAQEARLKVGPQVN